MIQLDSVVKDVQEMKTNLQFTKKDVESYFCILIKQACSLMYKSEHFSTVYLVWELQSDFNPRDMSWCVDVCWALQALPNF